MVVLTNKKDKSTVGFLMTLVPDKAYLESTHFDALRSNYKQWQKGFSGYVYYHTLDGNFNNAWKFANGKVIKEVTQLIGTDLNLDMRVKKKAATETCIYTTYEVWSQNCTDYSSNGEYDAVACGEWYYDGTTTEIECFPSGDTGGGGGVDPTGGYTGGGGNNNSGGGVTTNQVQVENLIPTLKSSLEAMGVDISGIVFRYTDNCISNARYYNGAIEICSKFLNYQYNDQLSIVWHELFHFHNDISSNNTPFPLTSSIVLTNVPVEFITLLRQTYLGVGLTEQQIQDWVIKDLTYKIILDPNHYLNEINAYQSELNNGISVSTAYSTEQEYLLWLNKQLYNIANLNYNK